MANRSRRLYIMPAERITQEMLASLVAADNEFERVKQGRADIANRVYDLLEGGASVEPGIFSAAIREERLTAGSKRKLLVNGKYFGDW